MDDTFYLILVEYRALVAMKDRCQPIFPCYCNRKSQCTVIPSLNKDMTMMLRPITTPTGEALIFRAFRHNRLQHGQTARKVPSIRRLANHPSSDQGERDMMSKHTPFIDSQQQL